ncbi:MAG: potassium channel protein [Planctomycetes bacterium]|nr:potassium channel protein [Planctomycetota bacterium]
MRHPGRWMVHIRGAVHRGVRWLRTTIPRRVWAALFIPALLLGIGTVGYRWIEGDQWSYFDGFYMTAITLTTIGYGETHELGTNGRIFTVLLAYSGIFTLAYFASELVRAVVTGELKQTIGRQWVDDKLATLTGHLIVCGYGRMGKIVCAELDRQKKWFVLIDKSPELLKDLPFTHCLPLQGDATNDELLRKAGIERARALVTVVGSDAENLYITLSARLLNAKLQIVARAEEEDAEVKLRKVGANKIISPYLAGGHRVVQAVLRPAVLHFMELATRPEFLDLQIEEVKVSSGSTLATQSLRHSRIHSDLGILVVGIVRPNGELLYNPPLDTIIEPEAVMIALGQRRHLDQLEKLATATA